MKRVYENETIRVVWDNAKCIHVGYCTRGLPQVFDVNKRPWININAADADEIKRVIDTCPTGALSYDLPEESKQGAATITVLKDGPYKVCGHIHLLTAEGEMIETGKVCALCRCGATRKPPFCDGTHLRNGFKDPEPQPQETP
ncbi:MAG: (4Fe-4S)-binding protein [Chloroflexi bacterium]|nr:(4Fe-4S)-binding protein [Chloroflexota bacterium]